MPVVPQVRGPQIALRSDGVGAPQPQASPQAFGSEIASATAGLGGSLDQAAQVMTNHLVVMQNQDNKANADNATVAFTDKLNNILYDPDNGYFVKKGKDAYDNYSPTKDAIGQARDQISATLANPKARELFDSDSRKLYENNMGSVGRHAAAERGTWLLDSSQAKVATAQNTAALNYNDDGAFNDAVGTIVDEQFHQGALKGQSEEAVRNNVYKAVGDAWNARIVRTMSDDPQAALELFNSNQDKLTARQQEVLGKAVHTLVRPQQTKGAADSVWSGDAPADVEKWYNSLEHRGEMGKPGDVSPKGALGVMQVMPATGMEAAKSLGVAYDPDKLKNDPDYGRAIGREYATKLLQKYDGNQTLATAAYNAGPGRVNDWIESNGDPRKGQITSSAWAAAIPFKETRDYVGRVVPANSGAPPSGDVEADAKSREAQAKAIAPQLFPDDEVAQDQFISAARAQGVGLKEHKTNAARDANNFVVNQIIGGPDGSGAKPTSIADITKTPEGKAAWLNLTPVQQKARIHDLEKNAQGPSVESPDMLQKYEQYVGMATSNPDAFVKTDVNSLDIPLGRRKSLMDLQNKVTQRKPINESLGAVTADPLIKSAMKAAKLDSGTPEYDQFLGKMQSDIDTFIGTQNRKPTQAELQQMSNQLISTSKGGIFGLGAGNRTFVNDPNHSLVPGVPNDQAKAIGQSFRTATGRAATSADIAGIYKAHTNAR